MNGPMPQALSITVHDEGGVPLLLLAGPPGTGEVWAMVDDRGSVRTLLRVRGWPPCLPECPAAPGCPSLAAQCRGALH